MITEESVWMTPEFSAKLLESNTRNRRPADGHIGEFAGTMRTGGWRDYLGDRVVIDSEGRVMNGAQRMYAGIDAEHTWKATLVRGVPPEDHVFVDAVRPRTAADDAQIVGIKDPGTVTALVRFVIEWEHGALTNRAHRASRDEIRNRLTGQEEELSEAVATMKELRRARRGFNRPATAGFAYVLLRQGDPARQFFADLTRPPQYESKNPARVLHEYIRARDIPASTREQLALPRPHHCLYLLCVAWRFHKEGKEMNPHQLRAPSFGAVRMEDIPAPGDL